MQVLMPETFDEAIAHKATHTDAVPMAGGTDLLVCWPEHPERHDRVFLDLSALASLRTTTWTDAHYEIGAMATYWDVLMDEQAGREFPMLHQAAAQVGAVQIQARGTWAGNVANGSPAADGVPVLMAYDAEVVLVSSRGSRSVPLHAFYHGYKQFESTDDELIERIRIPRRAHAFEAFEKVGSRNAQAITKIGVAIARGDEGWRIVANSMAPAVVRCPTVERMLDDRSAVTSPNDLLEAIRADVSPIDDVRSNRAYRETVMARVLYFALREHCDWYS